MMDIENIQNNVAKMMRFFPLSSFLAVILAIIGNILILDLGTWGSSFFEFTFFVIIGFFLSVWVVLHQHSVGKKGILVAYLFAMLIWAYLAFYLFDDAFNKEVTFFKSVFLTLGFVLSYIYVPFLKERDNNLKILIQVHQIRYALFGAFRFASLFGLGLIVIGVTLNFLFGINLAKLLGLIAFNGIFAIFLYIFFVTLMKNPVELEVDIAKYTSTVNRYLTGLLYAFTIIIFSALNLFVLKIIFTQELPKGQISWMVMGFSFFAFLSYLSFVPYKDKIKKYNTLLWGTLILQSLVLLGSIGVRVYEYGVTEKRYLLLAYGLWLLAISIYFVLKKAQAKIFWLFATLSMVILFSQIGPISGYSVSKYSQQSRLASLYTTFKFAQEEKEKERIFSKMYQVLKYLRRYHGVESIRSAVPEFKKKDLENYSDVRLAVGLEEQKPYQSVHENSVHFSINHPSIFRLKGYDYLLHGIETSKYKRSYPLAKGEKLSLEVDEKTMKLFAEWKNKEIEVNLNPFFEKVKNDPYPQAEEMSIIVENSEIKIRFYFFQMRHNPQYKRLHVSADIFVKIKEK